MSDKREWTAERHAAAKARCDAASKGPWTRCGANDGNCRCGIVWGHDPIMVASVPYHEDEVGGPIAEEPQRLANWRFIEEARVDLPDALREIDRLKADLLLLGALKSEEVAPVIERFREAFGADVPQAPSGKRAPTWARVAADIRDLSAKGKSPTDILAVLLATIDASGAPATTGGGPHWQPPLVRHARHDRHCMIYDGVGCSHEAGCEVER